MQHGRPARKMGAAAALALGLPVVGLMAACHSSTSPSGSPPVLSAAVVDLAQVRKFIPFGAELSPGRLNPAYEFVVNGTATEVRAATAGRVARVETNEQGDFELHVRPENDDHLIIYDHVLDPALSVGSRVEPGTRLGRVGIWTPTQGRVELQINRGNNLSICPRDLGTPEFNAAHDAALRAADPREQQPGWTNVCLAATVVP